MLISSSTPKLDEVIDALSLSNVDLEIEVSDVANVLCVAPFEPRILITNGELFDAVLDANGVQTPVITHYMRLVSPLVPPSTNN